MEFYFSSDLSKFGVKRWHEIPVKKVVWGKTYTIKLAAFYNEETRHIKVFLLAAAVFIFWEFCCFFFVFGKKPV